MHSGEFWRLHDVSDDALEERLKQLIASGTRTEARVVAHLAEVEARNLHLLTGRDSLFAYCKKDLRLSGNEAFYRIVAARMATRFPIIFDLLEQRLLYITTLPLLRDYISPENHSELLSAVCGKSKKEVLELLATRAPRPDARSHIRKLPPTAQSFAVGPTATLEPLSAASYRLQLNCSHALKEKLEQARDLMSHSNPTGDLAVIIERGLDLLIAKLLARRFGQTSRPRSTAPSPANAHDSAGATGTERESVCASPLMRGPEIGPATGAETEADDEIESAARCAGADDATAQTHFERSKCGGEEPPAPARSPAASHGSRHPRPHVSQQTRREVVERDGLRCAFVSSNGERCEARAFLQFEHARAFALGGSNDSDNLRLYCAHHNRLKAEHDFGLTQAHLPTGTRSRGS